MVKNISHIFCVAALALLSLSVCSCDERTESKPDVMLLYSAGYNTLSSYLKDDIGELTRSSLRNEADRKKVFVPRAGRGNNVLLVFSHRTAKYGDYETDAPPVLFRVTEDRRGRVTCDTLVTFPANTISASSETVHDVLAYIQAHFPARSYGMVLSSHASGWLPAGYYSNSERTVPMSVGQQESPSPRENYEIDLLNFTDAIPMHLNYILFDACLMGGVEVAYQLRYAADFIGFSQTEVLAEGFDYKTLARRLIGGPKPDPISVCKDFFAQYDKKSGTQRSATVSCIDCSGLQELARVCKGIFNNHRAELATIDPDTVQGYFQRPDKHWFYDLKDIVDHLSLTREERSGFDSAIAACVAYEAHTPQFLGIALERCCGFSTYLQNNGTAALDTYYRSLAWNKATSYVK